MKTSFSKEALNDLEKIWLYTFETWSLEQADRYINLLMDEIDYISANPKSGKEFSHVRKGYYRTKVRSHFIFYKIYFRKDELVVVRILHQQMDFESRLND